MLWNSTRPPTFPTGVVTLLAGARGAGKPLVLLELLEAVSRRGRFRGNSVAYERAAIVTTPVMASTLFREELADPDHYEFLIFDDQEYPEAHERGREMIDLVGRRRADILIVHPLAACSQTDAGVQLALKTLDAVARACEIAVVATVQSSSPPTSLRAIPPLEAHPSRMRFASSGATQDAAGFLRDALGRGAAAECEILWRARQMGISTDALITAKGELGVRAMMRSANGSRHRAWFLDRSA